MTGQATATPPATIDFTATVTDAAGATAQAALSLLVEPAIVISSAVLPATTSTAHYSASIAASGGTGAIAISTAPTALPAWLSLSPQGALTGTAPVVGAATDFNFMVTATDSVGVTASRNVTVTLNPLPKILTVKLPTGSPAVPYSAQLLANGAPEPACGRRRICPRGRSWIRRQVSFPARRRSPPR
ncbi:MAG: putative Ig domain-containing protein [Ignavibacteriota bacterium]